MTPGGKTRRHKKWERNLDLSTPFNGGDIASLLYHLVGELKDRLDKSMRTPEHDRTYRQMMAFMPAIVGKKRPEAYRMVVERAWKQQPMTCFDMELFQELLVEVSCNLYNVHWIDKRPDGLQMIGIDWAKSTSKNGDTLDFRAGSAISFRAYEVPGGVFGDIAFSKEAVDSPRAGPSIQELVNALPHANMSGMDLAELPQSHEAAKQAEQL